MSITTILIIGAVFVVILLIVGLVVSSNSERTLVEDRLGQYLEDEKSGNANAGAQTSAVTDWVSQRVEKTSYGDKIARNLARADLKIRVAEYFALIVISIFFGALLIWFIGNRHPISALLGAVIGAVVPGFYVRGQQRRRLQRFNEQLSDMLNLMVNGLRAGYSTMQALEAVSKELPSPIADEFRRVVQEMQIGITMDAALENLLRRIPSDDLDFVVTAMNVQREVGGNLSEILDTISFTIRERVRIKGEVRTLTAQVRTSGQILSMVPFGLAFVIWLVSPDYLLSITNGGPICTTIIICVALGLISSSYFIMMRIADIEV